MTHADEFVARRLSQTEQPAYRGVCRAGIGAVARRALSICSFSFC